MRRRLKAERGVRKACEKWLKEELRGRVRGNSGGNAVAGAAVIAGACLADSAADIEPWRCVKLPHISVGSDMFGCAPAVRLCNHAVFRHVLSARLDTLALWGWAWHIHCSIPHIWVCLPSMQLKSAAAAGIQERVWPRVCLAQM
jgi:hypothetical protein